MSRITPGRSPTSQATRSRRSGASGSGSATTVGAAAAAGESETGFAPPDAPPFWRTTWRSARSVAPLRSADGGFRGWSSTTGGLRGNQT